MTPGNQPVTDPEGMSESSPGRSPGIKDGPEKIKVLKGRMKIRKFSALISRPPNGGL